MLQHEVTKATELELAVERKNKIHSIRGASNRSKLFFSMFQLELPLHQEKFPFPNWHRGTPDTKSSSGAACSCVRVRSHAIK